MPQLRPISSLEKVFHDEAPDGEIFKGCSFLLDEEVSFQVAFCADEDCEVFPEIIAQNANCEAFWVISIPSGNPCYQDGDDYVLRREPGLFPDLLRPATEPMQIKAREWHSLWITFKSENSCDLTVKLGGEEVKLAFTCVQKRLPEQTLLCTQWFHCDGLAHYYGVEPFSEPYWEILERHVRCAAEHGNNLLLTPLFTPPLDTEIGGERLTTQLVGVAEENGQYRFDFDQLNRWFDMCGRCGITYFELSHLFTQWGAKHAPKIIVNGARRFGWDTDAGGSEYTDFLTQFAASLLPFLERHGILNRCYMHISDEPSMKDIEAYASRSALIKKIFPGVKFIDALSNFEFYSNGLIDTPIPSNDAIEPFIGNVPELWTYYCCCQRYRYVSNRFFGMPSARNRVLGLQLWKFRCAGFLHWGFNFWNTQFSTKPIDPFVVSDAGGNFASGDSYVVYPGEQGMPLCSLRLKVFHEALQDLRALQLLEHLIGYCKTLAVIEEGLDEPITFSQYPRGAAWLLDVRGRVNHKIASCILPQNGV